MERAPFRAIVKALPGMECRGSVFTLKKPKQVCGGSRKGGRQKRRLTNSKSSGQRNREGG